MYENITINKLLNLSNTNIIDVRSIENFNSNHIPGAKNISMESLLLNPNKYLNKYDTYYIYCQKGSRSKKICEILFRLGYKTVNILGGYEAWILEQ